MGPMFNKENKGKGDGDMPATDVHEQAVENKFQKCLAEDLISIDESFEMVEESVLFFYNFRMISMCTSN